MYRRKYGLTARRTTAVSFILTNDAAALLTAAFSRAIKLAGQTISKAAAKNWRNMGIYSLVLYGYVRPNGVIAVEM